MTEEVAKIKANKDGTYIDIVPEKCVSAQKAQYDENGRDLLDAESSQTIKGANTFAAKQTLTGGVAVSGTSAISGNVNMDSGAVAIGSAVTVENHGKITADNTSNTLKVAGHSSVLTGNDVLSAKDIMTANGDANNLVHRSGNEPVNGIKTFNNAIVGVASLPLFANLKSVETYLTFTFPFTMIAASSRGSMLVWIGSRTREAGALVRIKNELNTSFALTTIAVNATTSVSNIALSYDDSNMYLTIIGGKSASLDSVYAEVIALHEITLTNFTTPEGTVVSSIPGTLVKTFDWKL
jgi:hypothetical protein